MLTALVTVPEYTEHDAAYDDWLDALRAAMGEITEDDVLEAFNSSGLNPQTDVETIDEGLALVIRVPLNPTILDRRLLR